MVLLPKNSKECYEWYKFYKETDPHISALADFLPTQIYCDGIHITTPENVIISPQFLKIVAEDFFSLGRSLIYDITNESRSRHSFMSKHPFDELPIIESLTKDKKCHVLEGSYNHYPFFGRATKLLAYKHSLEETGMTGTAEYMQAIKGIVDAYTDLNPLFDDVQAFRYAIHNWIKLVQEDQRLNVQVAFTKMDREDFEYKLSSVKRDTWAS